ncbi:ABC transporter substrate-binding protein [Roseospira marina]|uniref:ABC transporter substrate-binding protein n=1 Tax=Roseospira marina TaxID=140057 RepID=A0A5M6I5I2_9PROT|nr:ABC transporter substrate-binding protein [Roseospira marina]KAA5603481.1 ABC transporter substrate-binding protein [Roseospira marina]MBB4316154.1 putative thiamine transport system substrate-binding protein [Roseospira marina]MBB5089342.1 putative thiamine transport system substrate-binding protein [Roseospira marina]
MTTPPPNSSVATLLSRRRLLATGAGGAAALGLLGRIPAHAAAVDPDSATLHAQWDAVRRAARGQTVHWNAWGGDETVNRYIAWVADQVAERHGITLHHAKVADIADVIARLLAEAAAGRTEGGSADLLWINGENFLTAKQAGLLYGPFATALPSWRYVDPAATPAVTVDFTVPTDGYESPWGLSQLTFGYDSARMPTPPATLADLTGWIQAHPGRFTYPAPPDFLGSTVLKQVLHDVSPDPAVLARPMVDFDTVTAPLWAWLAAVRPVLWREGRAFPHSGPEQRRLLADGEVDVYPSFHPSDASSSIAQGLLPPTVRTFLFQGGTIGNAHFVAIPATASAKAGALVVAEFLLSPEAQAAKQHPDVWGDDTVLAMDRLPPEARARFDALPLGPATIPLNARPPTLPEPHPSWMTAIEAEWRRIHAGG